MLFFFEIYKHLIRDSNEFLQENICNQSLQFLLVNILFLNKKDIDSLCVILSDSIQLEIVNQAYIASIYNTIRILYSVCKNVISFTNNIQNFINIKI